ncbi:ruBisCO-associated protein-like [Neltuma alba]|uniref:ruBisCO-associated protein-like n=1 Tax=Neltuma alba TaxID=207710 RepID=UPI0010A53024|nr:ruBisCO-associated protein-like [Prosopis alba]
MANPLSAYRVYASTLSSIEKLPFAVLEKEIHIVLAFARDYDGGGKYQTGTFYPYFDTSKLTPQAIQNIRDKATSTSVKFFLSIGGRNPKFPFAVTSAAETAWIQAATKSLREIIQNYQIDGIDVYYEHINPDAEHQFASSIQKVIGSLKRGHTITTASITVPAPLSQNYHDLYKINNAVFDYVVYQSHTETSPICTFEALGGVFDRLVSTYGYPKNKILAGHSDVLPGDWTTVPLPIFLGAVPQLLGKGLFGISKWIVTPEDYKPEA